MAWQITAARAGDVDIPEWQVPGDGRTPTFMQFLDAQGYDFKPATSLASATAKGDVVYSLDLELPPALLQPSLALNYSSDAGMNLEMPYGWSLGGIAEIRRPLVRAFAKKDDCCNGEWLISGPGFSGTLIPDGEDRRYFLRTSEPNLVTAEFNNDSNSWEIHKDGITWTLKEQDDGANTTDGTALWRAVRMHDTVGNVVSYSYFDDGRIKGVCYGGNTTTGAEHLVRLAFDYAQNAAKRTSLNAGF